MKAWATRIMTAAAMVGAAFAQPAAAQFFWNPPDLSGAPVTGSEPGIVGVDLPGATATEYRAALLWNLRSALNVAALQCDFEPTLLTVSNYNAALAHHRAELAGAFDTLGDYFQRTAGKGKVGQTALDLYSTKVYSGYSTVQAQRNFCQIAASVGRDAIFQPRGKLYEVAQNRMRELRNSLVARGETYFGNPVYGLRANLPSLDEKCWKGSQIRPACYQQWQAAQASAKE